MEEKNWWEEAPTYEEYLQFQLDVLSSNEDELNAWRYRQDAPFELDYE